LVKNRMAVETPAYGLEDTGGELDDGVELLVLDKRLRRDLCAFLESKSTPSGTMTAARPPGLSRRRNRARKSNSVFLVLTSLSSALDVDS
jgi:hypothetical protein